MNQQVMAALKEKRRQLSGQVELAQETLRGLVHQLDAVDAALRVFDPDIDLGALRERPVAPQSQSFRGEMVRLILTAMRERGAPMGVQEITVAVMEGRGLSLTNKGLVYKMLRRVSSSLRQIRKRGHICNVPSLTGRYTLWMLTPNAPHPINENAKAAT